MDYRQFAFSAMLLASLYTPLAGGNAGSIVIIPPQSDYTSQNSALLALANTTFSMRPSVLTTSLSPYGTGKQNLTFSVACVLLPSGAIVPNCTQPIVGKAAANVVAMFTTLIVLREFLRRKMALWLSSRR